MNSSNIINFWGVDIWRRTYWFVTYKSRTVGITDLSSAINQGTLSKAAVGYRSWAP